MFEDALAGVQAGRAGNFGYVVGVDRVGQADALREHGADVVVDDLAELLRARDPASGLPGRTVGDPRDRAATSTRWPRPSRCSRSSNGHIGLRGNLDEGEPYGLPGTYLGGFYEVRPLPYAEAGYGYPEDGQTVVNVTNGKIIRLLVEDEPFDLRYGTLVRHERVLDLRAGTLRREVEWVSPTGRAVRVTSTRLVSFTQRAVAAIRYEVEPVEDGFPVVVQSELVANEPRPDGQRGPARGGGPGGAARVRDVRPPRGAAPSSSTAPATSGLRMAAAMDHVVEGPDGTGLDHRGLRGRRPLQRHRRPRSPASRCGSSSSSPTAGRRSARCRRCATRWRRRAPGRGTPAGRGCSPTSAPTSTTSGPTPTSSSRATPSCSRRSASRSFTPCRPGARGEQRAIAAKGLTGPGYDGHTFWDTETFVLPVLTYTAPAGRGRRAALAPVDARPRRASAPQTLGLAGAAFPWRTIDGAGVLELLARRHRRLPHQRRHRRRRRCATWRPPATRSSSARSALELLVETARLWRSLGHHDAAGHFRIDGVTGPDEYSAVADNNVYTNLMAQRNLRAAADVAERHPHEAAARLGVDDEEAGGWRDAAAGHGRPLRRGARRPPPGRGLHLPPALGLRSHPPEQYPLLLHFPYFDLYRKQVVKQADLVLALLYLRRRASPPSEKARDFEYYEPLTVRDSSLSACTQAVIAAEVGHLELAYDYFAEAALMDLGDLEHNTARRDPHRLAGRHLDRRGRRLRGHARPRRRAPLRARGCPGPLTRLRFRIMIRGSSLAGRRRHTNRPPTRCSTGRPLKLRHHGNGTRGDSSEARVARDPQAGGAAGPAPAARPRTGPSPPPPLIARRDCGIWAVGSSRPCLKN